MQRRFSTSSHFLLLLFLLLSVRAHAQHAITSPAFDTAAGDAKRFQLAPGLKLDVWAAEPQLSNSVAFAFDGKGRVYLAESDRWAISVFDITQHTNWLWQDMSFRSVADRGAFLTNQFATNLAFLTKDSEVVRRVEDHNGDGQADHTEILASGFTNAVDGTAAGVLATREGIYFANIPSLWLLSTNAGQKASGPESQSENPSGLPATGPSGLRPPSDPRHPSPATRHLLASGFGVHIGVSGHDLHGLIKGPDGRIYMSFGDRGCVLTNREGVVISLPDTGGVLRCEPDGRDLEVFCYGLRNPQELAFDDFGNLWTVDNDTAGADPCRVLHLVEGGDYGWRTSYQHMDGFGPWVQEELWKGGQDGILPPAGAVSQGPSGLAFYPGTGFGERLTGTFLHADFPGGVWAYTVKPQGASYVVDRKEKFLWNCWPTDVDFGPDGAAYVLDWVSGWGQTPRGRIYRITPNDVAAEVTRRTGSDAVGESASSRRLLREAELVTQVKQLLAEGMTHRGEKELLDLLGHADRRVRLEAQWELAARLSSNANVSFVELEPLVDVAHKGSTQFARIHAIWTLQIVARESKAVDCIPALAGLIPLTSDKDDEIRIAAANCLAEGGLFNAKKGVVSLIDADNISRTRFTGVMASSALGINPARRLQTFDDRLTKARSALAGFLEKHGLPVLPYPEETDFAITQPLPIRGTNVFDPFLTHAVAFAMEREFRWDIKRGQLGQTLTKTHAHSKEPAIRAAAALAMRRLTNSFITNFLSDSDPRLTIAAGRAIHDVPIVEGFPALAAFITKIDCPTNLMSRVINACYRLGTQQHAQMLAGFAAREDVPDWARVFALRALADWEKPAPLDRVNGLWRPLVVGERPPSPLPSPPGRGGNVVSPSGNEPDQPTAPSSPSPDNPSLTPPRALTDSSTRPNASPSPGGEGRGEGGPTPRSAIPPNPLLERAAQAQAARNLGRAAELPVLPADLGRSVPYDEAMALRRNPAPAQRAFLRVAGDLMNPFNLNEAGQPAGTREVLPLQIAVAEAAAKLRVKEAGTPLFEKFARTNTAPELRRAILPALAELRSPLTGEAVRLALADPDARLRATALPYLDRLEGDSVEVLVSLVGGPPSPRPSPPGRGGNAVSPSGNEAAQPTAPPLLSPDSPSRTSPRAPTDSSVRPNASPSPGGEGRGEGGRLTNIPLAQAALSALAKLPGAKADEAVRDALASLEAQQLPTELALDVREAARTRGLAAQRAALPELLIGGNAERGRHVFFQNQTVQCLRCHRVGNDGGIVGPELTGIGKRQTRDYLLESILQPNAKIAAGFENVVLTLSDGSSLAGSLKGEGDGELTIEVTGDDGVPTPTKVVKSKISQRARGPSAMPEGLADTLTPFEIRDLVEYLATLR